MVFFAFQVFIKSELKVGVIYVKENQYTEEEILDNNENSPMFDEFLQVMGEKVRLKGIDVTLFKQSKIQNKEIIVLLFCRLGVTQLQMLSVDC